VYTVIPWWAKSPSPFSILFYLLLLAYGHRKLPKPEEGFRSYIVRLTSIFFLIGIPVLICDLHWVIACILRFGASYPDSVLQLVFCAVRDGFGAFFCYYLTHTFFIKGYLNLSKRFYWFLGLNMVFITFWFMLSPCPAYTDWTFALRYGFPPRVILTSFLISHVLGRVFVALVYASMFNISKVLNTTKHPKKSGDRE
jgi:hypothetical protein